MPAPRNLLVAVLTQHGAAFAKPARLRPDSGAFHMVHAVALRALADVDLALLRLLRLLGFLLCIHILQFLRSGDTEAVELTINIRKIVRVREAVRLLPPSWLSLVVNGSPRDRIRSPRRKRGPDGEGEAVGEGVL